MGAKHHSSTAPRQLVFVLVGWVIVLIGCATPPVPVVSEIPESELAAPTAAATGAATASAIATRTFTSAPAAVPSVTPVPAASELLTRPIVNPQARGVAGTRALRFCELPQVFQYQNRTRVYCLHPETISFDDIVTALGEVMHDRYGLRDMAGNALIHDSARRCDFNLCYAYVWYDKENPRNAYALLRLYPVKLETRQVVPLLELKPEGDPELLHDWQVVLVDVRSGEVVQVLDNPFVPLARGDALAFNATSGFFEVVDRSGPVQKGTGKRLGLQLTSGQVSRTSAVIQEITLFNFSDSDTAAFTEALKWLQAQLPDWHAYFLAQRPFEIYYEPSLASVSDGICCRIRNGVPQYGRIRLRDPMHDWTSNSFPGESHEALARWSLVTLLIHEATHVRDLRTDRFGLRTVPSRLRDCVMHISTDEIEILFSQDASAISVSTSVLTQGEYVATIEEFVQELQSKQLPAKQRFCGDYYNPAFDGLMP